MAILSRVQAGFRLFDGTVLNNIINQLNGTTNSTAAVNTAISTVGAGTLTAAAIVGGYVNRTGSTAAYTDTTATGAQLDTALGTSAVTGFAKTVFIANNTAFVETIAGGTGVTVSGNTVISPYAVGQFVLTRTGTATYTLVGVNVDDQSTFGLFALVATADNGTTQTLTTAMITGASHVFHTSAGGSTPSLTLPLGSAMDTAMPNLKVGQSYVLRIINTNSGIATIVTNTGWTLTGTLTLAANGGAPNGTWSEFVVTKTGTATYTGVNVGTGTKV